ncbi:hypothetical protein [Gordonia humi]|uniref:Uncharacterized protein n=1 Tax=Gordonia humi TaxID=686429 RepID=A0A840F4V7_9ACTN|nr:hypothetical protein [Gordonia humi]MBB4136936.1 hypothetical protein [Gordonia humi]
MSSGDATRGLLTPLRLTPLRRGFVTLRDPADGPDLLWAPGLEARPVLFGSPPIAFRGGGWGSVVPVVYDETDPSLALRLDDRIVEAGSPVLRPDPLELLCPSPGVPDFQSYAADPTVQQRLTTGDPILTAFALRLVQTTALEAQELARAADAAGVSAGDLDEVVRAGPGMEHYPDFIDVVLPHLPREALGNDRRRLLHAVCVAAALRRRRGIRGTILHRASDDRLDAVLGAFTSVCGPIPGIAAEAGNMLRPPPPVADQVDPPRACRVLEHSRSGVVVEASTALPAVGDVVALTAGPTTHGDAAFARHCSHHRIGAAHVDDGRAWLSVDPPPSTSATAMVAVDRCRSHLVHRPDEETSMVGLAGRAPAVGDMTKRRWWRARPRRDGVTADATQVWNAAMREHDRIRSEYLAYEMDPGLRTGFPSVTDVTRPETAEFVSSMGLADALRREDPTDTDYAEQYHRAVANAARLWALCESAARRTGG